MPMQSGPKTSGGGPKTSGGMSSAQMWQGASGLAGVYGVLQAGRVAKQVGRMRHRLAKLNAQEVVASAQRDMLATRRETELLASRALAVAAAGGGGVDDPTVINIIGDINAEGAYREAVAMYEGEAQAQQIRYEGKLAKWEGKQASRASKIQAVGKIAQTSAMISSYG